MSSGEEREFAVRHFKCESCGFTAAHKSWEFPFPPYESEPIELANNVKIYTENGEIIVEAPDEGKWAVCSSHASGGITFYWICRRLAAEPKNPCNGDFMQEISS